jgi:Ca2+/Na+ antiporter
MNRYLIISKNWLGYAAVVTLLCFLVYVVAQQTFRQSANDPQYQLAQDAASAINKGADPKSIVGAAPVEISTTFSPYLLIYDAHGNSIGNNITLDGKTPKLPNGVLETTRRQNTNVVTWQPRAGLRQATVMVSAGRGYTIVAGRSLQTTEERISTLGMQVLFGWIASLAAMAVIVLLQELMTSKMNAA